MRSSCCDDWVGNLNLIIGIDTVKTELIFNSNTDNRMALVKLWDSYSCYRMDYKRSALHSDVYVFLVMSTFFGADHYILHDVCFVHVINE